MIQITPAILEEELVEIQKKVKIVKPYFKLVQLDVMDGEFVPNHTYNLPDGIDRLGVKVEAHLMINHPEFYIAKWALPNVVTIVIHQEAVSNMEEALRLIKNAGKKAGLAINPGTSTYEIEPYLDNLDLVVVMGVSPGFSGQAFNPDVLEKIRHLKKLKPNLPVEVDGGVNLETKNMILAAGADILAVNSVLFNDPGQIKENISRLSD